ncbi:MAG: polysaccharide deacetylase family protein [Rhodospirillales bacterium]|nr:polysaccharide deacetylase family protein [Rhodospirillales bacterium]
MPVYNRLFAALLLLAGSLIYTNPAPAANALPEDRSKAVILAYTRIGEDDKPDESLTEEQFIAHIREIKTGGYHVLPLPDILDHLENNRPLPPLTLAITLDGAYRSAMQNAVPHLLAENLPFTVFYAADPLDQHDSDYASWQDLKSLKKHKNVTLATLPASYSHVAHATRTEMLAALNKARQRHREEFAAESPYLAYPFGEYALELKDLAQTQGFKAAFGLHSGAAYPGADLYALPRFTMTEQYGDPDRLRMVARALPLPTTDIEPADPNIKANSFYTGFTLPGALSTQTEQLSCFISGHGRASIVQLGNRIEIREDTGLLDDERIRLNCTMPGPNNENNEAQWRWLGLLYFRNPERDEPRIPPAQNASAYSQSQSSMSP